MTFSNDKIETYLGNYFQEGLEYLESGNWKKTVGIFVANLLHWLLKYMIIPTGAVILYVVLYAAAKLLPIASTLGEKAIQDFTFTINKYKVRDREVSDEEAPF